MELGPFVLVAVLSYLAGMLGSFAAALVQLATVKGDSGGFVKMFILAGSAQVVKTMQLPKIALAAFAAFIALSYAQTIGTALLFSSAACFIAAFAVLTLLFMPKR